MKKNKGAKKKLLRKKVRNYKKKARKRNKREVSMDHMSYVYKASKN